MPRIKQETVYTFDELSDRAKERAREWYRRHAFDHEWYDGVYEDAKTSLALAGFTVDRIYFSGFSSQGDGAMFEGSWRANATKPVKAMKQHAPKDKTLHELAATMRRIAKAAPGSNMGVKHRGHYHHEYETYFEVDVEEGRPKASDRESIIEASRKAMRWIYRSLEREHDWLLADEQVDESIQANEYEFSEEGRRA